MNNVGTSPDSRSPTQTPSFEYAKSNSDNFLQPECSSSINQQLNFAPKCGCIKILLEEAILLNKAKADKENFDITGWSNLFQKCVIRCEACTNRDCLSRSDDMLWYVKMVPTSSVRVIGQNISQLQVFRRPSKNKPSPNDPYVNWRETVFLNLILQQLDYYVTCAVCAKAQGRLQIIRRNIQRIHPSPSRRRMDTKGESEEITYPKIYFAIDNFEEAFNDIMTSTGECICVELIARDRNLSTDIVLFMGSIRHEVLKDLYDSRSGKWGNWTQRFSAAQRFEFVKMRGPRGKGFAEMAVTKLGTCGFDTPMSECAFNFDLENKTNFQRRTSDVSFFNKILYGGNERAKQQQQNKSMGCEAQTACNTPTSATPHLPGQRTKRWVSESEDYYENDADNENTDTTGKVSIISRTSGVASWSMRGLGQALQFLRQPKDETAEQLNAFLTYITLDWDSIIEDIINPTGRKPIFTLGLDLYLKQVQKT